MSLSAESAVPIIAAQPPAKEKRKRKDRASDEAAKGSPLWTVYHWTVKLAEYGHLAAMTGAEAKVWLAIFSYVSVRKQTAYPGAATIKKLAGVNRRTVFRALKDLERKGLIQRTRKGGGFNHETNEYTFKAPPETAFNAVPSVEIAPSDIMPLGADAPLGQGHTRPYPSGVHVTQTEPENKCQLTGTGGGGGEASRSAATPVGHSEHPAYQAMVALKVWPAKAAEVVAAHPGLPAAVVHRQWEELHTDGRVKQKENALVKRLKLNGAALIEQWNVAEAERVARVEKVKADEVRRRQEREAAAVTKAGEYEKAIAKAAPAHIARYQGNAKVIDSALATAGAVRGTARYDKLVMDELCRLGLWGHDAASKPGPIMFMQTEQTDVLAFDGLIA